MKTPQIARNMGGMLGPRWIVVVACLACALPWSRAEENTAWTAADTAMANQYIQSLEQKPENGRVLELLWKLYEDHGQTRLLLQYFEEASKAAPAQAQTARILHGHLLRRKGNSDQALEQYRAVLAASPGEPVVLRAVAEILREEGELEEALAEADLWEKAAPAGSADVVAASFFRAELLRELQRPGEAVEIWKGLMSAQPTDVSLTRRIIDLFLEQGETAEAAAGLERLAQLQAGDAESRLDALRELGRLREARNEPEEAVAVYEGALATLHFRHFKYDGFLTSLIRVREQFGGLDELSARWEKGAAAADAAEEVIWRMVRFAQLTADAPKEEEWLSKLAARAPSNAEYQQQLAAVCFRNDHVEEAGRIVEKLVKTVAPLPADMVFLRAEIQLRQGGPPASERILGEFLDQGSASPELRKRVLRFAETHYLDGIIQRLLLDQKANGWGEEGAVVELKLAAFQHERGRDDAARETLRAYVSGARDAAGRARRIVEAARSFAELGMRGEALGLLEGLVKTGEAERAHHLLFAELTGKAESADRAVEALEAAWQLSRTLEEREEVDDRIFNLLRAQDGGGDLNAPDQDEGEVWKELWDFYQRVKNRAPDDAAPELRYRAAWWAVRIGDRDEAYRILPMLHDPENPVLAYEELLLDLAERTENQALVVRQLELISGIDPGREEEALIRKAEMRLKLKFEDEAIRMLQSVVDRPGASLKAVQALARAYLQQGRHRALEELWGEAFATANLLERREILEPYTETLTRLGKIPDALELHGRMIAGESDLAQRRKLFDDQLALASRHYLLDSWMRPRYEELARLHPLDAFYPEALARMLQATGKYDEAFAAMKRAYYLSGGASALLPALAELASKANELEAAIYFQRQLIAGNGSESPEEWLSLIARLEESLDAAGANRVRRELETRFAQDGDFLRELARASQSQGDPASALRIWGQVVALRPWDAASRFEYGLLQLDLGRTKEAGESFEAVLAATAATAKGGEAYPLWAAPREDDPAGQPFAPPLRIAADAVDQSPFLASPQRDDAVAWLLQARTEYMRKPPDARGLRLRSIEELARLRGRTEEWRREWSGDGAGQSASEAERLWAVVHAGAAPWTAEWVQKLTAPAADAVFLGKFRYCLLSLRTGNDAALLAWAGTDAERRQHVLLGIDVLLRDPGFEFGQERLATLMQAIAVRLPDARRLMQNLYQDGLVRQALEFGEAMAQAGPGTDYTFYQDVADLAGELGDDDAANHWTLRAFEELNFRHRVLDQVPFPTVHRIVSWVVGLELPRWPRDEIAAHLSDRLCDAPGLTEAEQTEAGIWFALALGQPERALRDLEILAGLSPVSRPASLPSSLKQALPVSPIAGLAGIAGMSNPGVSAWERIENLFILVGDRLPFREPLDRMAGVLIDRSRPASGPGNEEALQRFAEVRIRYLLWTLETANRPVRQRLIQEFLAMACGEDVHFALALGLERQGMAAEALPVYAELLRQDSRSIEAARGFFTACREIHAYDDALAVIGGYREGSLPRPSAMTAEFLHRSRANFLFLAGRVEELARVAQEGQLGENGPSSLEAADRAIYQRALAAVYEERGDLEAAVRVLESLRDGPEGLSKPDQIHLADCQLQMGRDADAVAVLRSFKLREGDPNTDAVLRRLGGIHARQGAPGAAELRRVAVQAGRLSVSMPVCIELASALAEVGLPEVADALLEVRARRTTEPGARFQAGRKRVEIRQRAQETVMPPDPELLLSWLRGWSGAVEEGEAVLALAQSAPGEQRPAWATTRAILETEPRTRLLADLLRLSEGAEPAVVAKSIAEYVAAESPGPVRLAAKVLSTRGQAEAARNWMREVHRRREANPAEDTALMLQICQAGKDTGGLNDWRDRLARYRGSHSSFIDHAAEFFRIGQADLALGLMEQRYQSLHVLTEEQRYFLNNYVRHLIREWRLEQAGRVLLTMFQKSLGGDPALLVDYYRAAGKLERLEGELDKYYLSRSERERVLSLMPTGALSRRPETSAVR